MKRLTAICFLLILALSLVACGQKEKEEEPSYELEPLPTIPTYEGTDIADSPFVGEFTCTWSGLEHSSTEDTSWEGRISSLTCNADGTFVLTFNGMDDVGYVQVSGSFKVENDEAFCTVEARDKTGYLGEELTTFSLELIDEDEMRYRGEQQGYVADRDVFARVG